MTMQKGMPNVFEMFAILMCVATLHFHFMWLQIATYATIFLVFMIPRGALQQACTRDPLPALGLMAHGFVAFFGKIPYERLGFRQSDNADAKAKFAKKLEQGERCLLVGVTSGTHNAGAALVEVSLDKGITLLCSNEEERFSGKKHDYQYPEQSLAAMREHIASVGASEDDIVAACISWDFLQFGASWARFFFANLPFSLLRFWEGAKSWWNQVCGQCSNPNAQTTFFDVKSLSSTPKRLAQDLKRPVGLLGMRHHDNHAYMSYALSPFYGQKNVIVLVTDGMGDDATMSFYTSDEKGKLQLRGMNKSFLDSLGILYQTIASTQGGWTPLSCEGRYMGAAAWGDLNRLTNPHYQTLRQLVVFGENGQVLVNREMANWFFSEEQPYLKRLKDVLGDPIPPEKYWNPDALLQVDDVQTNVFTRKRCDKAAALQLVFEDCIIHIARYLITGTFGDKLVWTGGCALNCRCSMTLLETFDIEFYKRLDTTRPGAVFRQSPFPDRQLHLWVPPFCSDAGVAAGSCYSFVHKHWPTDALPPIQRLPHAFFCGSGCSAEEIERIVSATPNVQCETLSLPEGFLADLLAYIVSKDGVIGLFQGAAEIGPRALGHRSILANPTNPRIRDILNERVKLREQVRPLAPMVTLNAAKELFVLEPGASDLKYDAYRYMVLCARAKPGTKDRVPAVVHADGTSRLQVVDEDDGLAYAYLTKMGEHVGVQCSVNTSLNIGSPIVQTPDQAIRMLLKSGGMHGILFTTGAGSSISKAFLVYPSTTTGVKRECGEQLQKWLAEWRG
eukprot:gnl/MRDRNA2_/MRDRNA2_17670_c0_seq1.p1 gnl/MRDRNA2_/MRDRNA2_17670_c0~~gnl/MRDRNA2_/MRDRNA2_17670_c0_seq1.p1  ORF type:complete len:788 (-),score=140.17 gnl/MRDRNA2_/MRDRNA2_17670_c0_seq1:41-2404(-)